MSDVTRRMTIRLIGLFAMFVVVAVAVTLGLTARRSPAPVPALKPRPSLLSRVPGAALPASAGEVLPPVGPDSPVPSDPALRRTLQSLITAKALGGGVSVDVLDPLTGKHLLTQSQLTARTPASTAKLLTSAAALSLLGPRTTLATTVVAGTGPGQLVLVGGGDVLLAQGESNPDLVNGRAGLTTLAQQTAASLRARGQTGVRPKVTLALDDRLFTGPARAPGWAVTDVPDGFVAPVYPLEIDAGRMSPDAYAQRADDPALAAAEVFAGLLKKQGVDVTGAVFRAAAPRGSAVLGEVESAPVSAQVEYALTESDNTVAETLGRLVAARAGRPASFTEVGPAVLAQDEKLGVPVTAAVLADGSGLSASSKVPAITLTGLLAAAISDRHPELRSILSGLPIAAVSGTLVDRFAGANQRLAAGDVRAKTGTLSGVSSLAGTVVDRDGRLLVFAVMADQVTSTDLARAALDKVAGALAGCGCR